MTGKTALGSLCAGLALLFAVRSPNQAIQTTASLVGSSLLGYTATTFVLDRKRQRKSSLANAEAYLELLRQINQEAESNKPPIPVACRGCCNYHGRVYGGQLLVCAMHPYGVEVDHCPDWQTSACKPHP